MSWEMPQEYQEYLAPSLAIYCIEKAENEKCDPQEVALSLLEDQLHDCEESDFEGDKDVFEQLPLDSLLTIIAMNVDTMTNGARAFCIDSQGWTTVPVCSEDEMLAYWS